MTPENEFARTAVNNPSFAEAVPDNNSENRTEMLSQGDVAITLDDSAPDDTETLIVAQVSDVDPEPGSPSATDEVNVLAEVQTASDATELQERPED